MSAHYEPFFLHCQNAPEAIALKWKDQVVTYHDLAQYVGAIQHFLISHFPPQTPVYVFGHSHPYLYAAILALLSTGYPYIPLNPQFPDERNSFIRQHFPNAPLLYIEKPAFSDGIDLASIVESDRGTKLLIPPRPLSGLAYVLFTSGSTGTPKGVCITYANLNAFLRNLFSIFSFSPHDRFLQMFDFTFDLSIFSFLIPLLVGASFYPTDSTEFKYLQIPELIEEEKITVALLVPSVISFLIRYRDEFRFPSLRYNLFCGEPLSHSLLAEWTKTAPNASFHNVYGPTETTVFCSHYRWEMEQSLVHQDVVSIGKPFGSNRFSLRSLEDHKPIREPYHEGELVIMGEQVGSGYLNQAELTRKAFFTENQMPCYATGDLAFFDENGNYYFLGRKDDQVKIQGYRVELQEIVAQIRQRLPEPRNVVVLVQNEGNQQILHGVIEGFCCIEPSVLLQSLSTVLPSYMVPRKIHFVEQFPLSTNGKVDKKALASLLFQGAVF